MAYIAKKKYEMEKIEKETTQCVFSFQSFNILKILALKISVKVQTYCLLDKVKLDINLQTKIFNILF